MQGYHTTGSLNAGNPSLHHDACKEEKKTRKNKRGYTRIVQSGKYRMSRLSSRSGSCNRAQRFPHRGTRLPGHDTSMLTRPLLTAGCIHHLTVADERPTARPRRSFCFSGLVSSWKGKRTVLATVGPERKKRIEGNPCPLFPFFPFPSIFSASDRLSCHVPCVLTASFGGR